MSEKNCAYCGKKFMSNKHFKKYCSKECFKKSRGCYFPAKSLIKKCEVCGKEFVSTENRKTCSADCLKKLKDYHIKKFFKKRKIANG